jgi:hypothetical protein
MAVRKPSSPRFFTISQPYFCASCFFFYLTDDRRNRLELFAVPQIHQLTPMVFGRQHGSFTRVRTI